MAAIALVIWALGWPALNFYFPSNHAPDKAAVFILIMWVVGIAFLAWLAVWERCPR
jgi:hypothetical protein